MIQKPDEFYEVKRHWLVRLWCYVKGTPCPPVRWRRTHCTVCCEEIRTSDPEHMEGPRAHTLCVIRRKAVRSERLKRRRQQMAMLNMLRRAVRDEMNAAGKHPDGKSATCSDGHTTSEA